MSSVINWFVWSIRTDYTLMTFNLLIFFFWSQHIYMSFAATFVAINSRKCTVMGHRRLTTSGFMQINLVHSKQFMPTRSSFLLFGSCQQTGGQVSPSGVASLNLFLFFIGPITFCICSDSYVPDHGHIGADMAASTVINHQDTLRTVHQKISIKILSSVATSF